MRQVGVPGGWDEARRHHHDLILAAADCGHFVSLDSAPVVRHHIERGPPA